MEYFGTSLTEHGHYRRNIDGGFSSHSSIRFDDLPFHPEHLTNTSRLGEVVFYQSEDYTVIAINGSCVDHRPGSKSVFWEKEYLTKDDMIKRIIANPIANKILKQMKFQIRWDYEL